MTKQIVGLLLLLVAGLGVSAQTTEKTVVEIRSYYKDISEKARLAESDDDQGELGELVMNELVINKRNHQWRAVGVYGQTYKFFYSGGDSEAHLYPDQLVLVRVGRKVSNRVYLEEYLYSKSGELIFCFQKSENDDQVPAERRVYFSGIKAIRIAEDEKIRDRLTARDAQIVKEIFRQSRKIKEIFIRSIKL